MWYILSTSLMHKDAWLLERSMYTQSLFNADLYPGNILIMPEVCILYLNSLIYTHTCMQFYAARCTQPYILVAVLFMCCIQEYQHTDRSTRTRTC
jgi:hypothetical protein